MIVCLRVVRSVLRVVRCVGVCLCVCVCVCVCVAAAVRGTDSALAARTLASGLWSHPVLLTKGKDPSFDTAWKAWRDSIQVACAFLVIPGPGHMGDSCLIVM